MVNLDSNRGFRIAVKLLALLAFVIIIAGILSIVSKDEASGIAGSFCLGSLIIFLLIYLIKNRDSIFEGWPGKEEPPPPSQTPHP